MIRRDRDKLEQEPDRVPTRRLALIGIAGLLVFAGAALWSSRVQLGLSGSIHSDTAGRADHAGEREVGMVYQRPFEKESIAAARSEDARKRLGSAGWVDRERGLVRVPIEQAMEIVARRGKL
jgi:hypothetical protein